MLVTLLTVAFLVSNAMNLCIYRPNNYNYVKSKYVAHYKSIPSIHPIVVGCIPEVNK